MRHTRVAPRRAAQPPRRRNADDAGPRPRRRYELDWLRAAIVLGLIPFHAAVIFGATSAVGMKSGAPGPQATLVLGLFAGLALLFGMPLLFFIAGAGSWFALDVRTGSEYVKERLLRLMVPLVVGSLVLVPVQAYFILLSNPALVRLSPIPLAAADVRRLDVFPAFYIQYLLGYRYFLGHINPGTELIFFMHLWFLPRLLVYSLLVLPLFVWLRRPSGRRLIERLAAAAERRGAVLLLALPLSVSDAVLQTGWLNTLTRGWPIYDDWQAFAFGLILFVYGYVLYADARIAAAIARQAPAALALGLAACGLVVAGTAAGRMPVYTFTPGYAAYVSLRAFGIWSLILGIVGMAMRLLTFTNGVGRYLNEATYALYLIHFPLLTVIAFCVLQWHVAWPVQLALIVVATLIATLLVYDLAIKRTAVTRLLFGLRAHPAAGAETRQR